MPENLTVNPSVRLVIIEDYKLLRLGLVSFLEKEEHIEVVGQAESAEQGLEIIKATKPDLVLMDLGLPGMNGIEATRQVRALELGIKVMVLTSHENEDEVLAALGAGANAYCIKNTPSEKLIEIIHAVHQGAAWLDPAIAAIGLKIFQQAENYVDTGNKTDWELTPQERNVLSLIAKGHNNNQIAEALHISVHTAKAYVSKVLHKMAVNDRVQAAVKGVKSGII